MKTNFKVDNSIIKSLLLASFYFSFLFSYSQESTKLTLINSYDIDDVGEPSGLSYDKVNNQLFSVSDSDDIFRLSTKGKVLDTYDFSADLEGVTNYNIANTLLIAIEDTYELIEYNYITKESTTHKMDYDNQDDPGSGIEGVTYNPTNGEIYFLNEKDPAALIVANSNFNVTNEYRLTFSGDLSASSYVEETGFLWLGSDEESTIYKCNTQGNVFETFTMEDSDGDLLDKLEGIAVDYDNQLLYVITDGDAKLYVYQIDVESTITDTLTVSTLDNFEAEANSKTINVTSNTDWNVSENSSWVTINTTSGSNDGSITISVNDNTTTTSRTATVTVSSNNITRTITITQNGNEEEIEESIPAICSAGTNLSLNATIADYSSQENTQNNAENIIYGDETNRWSAQGFPQYIIVDLGNAYDINEINLIPYSERAYQFTIEGSTTSATSGFNTILDASDNTDGGNLITKEFTTQSAQYVKLTITGAAVYTGNWASIIDFKIKCAGQTEIEEEKEDTSCTSGSNLSLNSPIIEFSAEQNSTNSVSNLFDGYDTTRWSAQGYPQSVVFDLGAVYDVNQINLYPYLGRAYQFKVQGSATSPDNGYSTLRDVNNNTMGGFVITREFDTYQVRYIRLTVNSAADYDGAWVSINQFEVICAGSEAGKSLSIDNSIEVSSYPTPFTNSITVDANNQIIGNVKLLNLFGKVIKSIKGNSNEITINNLDDLTSGMYLIQVLNTENQIINTKKVLKK